MVDDIKRSVILLYPQTNRRQRPPVQSSVDYRDTNSLMRRSQWPLGLRRRSAAARLLRLWVRIPPSRGLCDVLIIRPEESYRLVRRWVCSRNLVNEEALAHWGLLHQLKKMVIVVWILLSVCVLAQWIWETFWPCLLFQLGRMSHLHND